MTLLLAMSATRITVIVVLVVLWLLFACGWFKHLTGWPRDDDVDELKTLWELLWSNRIMVVVSIVLQLMLAALVFWLIFTTPPDPSGAFDGPW